MQREDTTNIMSKKNVENIENQKAAIEEGRELSMREKVAAYMANHAAEHFAAACNDVELEDVEELLANTKKEEGVYWLFTCPVIGGVNSDGKPNPTREEWEAANKGAIRCDVMDSKQWYKKAVTLEDANTVRRVLSSLSNYMDAREKGKARLIAALKAEMASAFLADDMEKAMSIKAQLKELGE